MTPPRGVRGVDDVRADGDGDDTAGPGATLGLTPEIAAEASVWIARLHGPDRSLRMERDCLAWQARSAAHRLAFERCTEVWQAVPQLSLADAYASGSARRVQQEMSARRWRARWAWGGTMLVIVALAAAGAAVYLARITPDYATGVGEQRSVVLADGSLLSLNTDTRVKVDMTPALRAVRVMRGEALFEVAKDASRPFVVHASGSDVVALGTAFAVRLTDPSAQARASVAVTLIEGRVTVRPTRGHADQGAMAPAGDVQLRAGERLRLTEPVVDVMPRKPTAPSIPFIPFNRSSKSPERPQAASARAASAVMTLDRPRIDQLMAWKRSEVVFDDVSLAEAVGEMNRYSRVPIVLPADATLTRLRVSGSYRAGDGDGFALAVATLHSLVVRRHDGRLELLRPQ